MLRSICLVVGITALVACSRTKSDGAGKDPDLLDQAGTTTLTNAQTFAADTAVRRMVTARCERQVQCSNIAPEQRLATSSGVPDDLDLCVDKLTAKLQTDFRTAHCPNGVDGDALDRCVGVIRAESCNNPVDEIVRMADCRTGKLCAH